MNVTLYDVIEMFENYQDIARAFANHQEELQDMLDLIAQRKEIAHNIDLAVLLTGDDPIEFLNDLDFIDNQITRIFNNNYRTMYR